MKIENGNWPFCVGGIMHDDAKYKISFTDNGQNGVWLCPACYEELRRVISETHK